MRILFFDTETNGLPRHSYAPITDLENWPRVLQIAWQLWDLSGGEFTNLVTACHMIKPNPEMLWNAGSAVIHKISRERAIAEGVPGTIAFREFKAVLDQAHVVVAHNISFDKPVIIAECLRLQTDKDYSWWKQIEFCTCLDTRAICKIPALNPKANDPYKRPKLIELYTFLHESAPAFNFHSADGDTECLLSCFQKLLERRLVPIDDWTRRLRVLGLL